LLVVGAGVGAVFALVAVNRFWWLILVLFAARASLDVLKPSDSGGGLEAGTIVGVVFLATAAVWLFAQWRSGELERFSPVSKAMIALAAAHLASTPGAELPFDSVQASMKYVAVAVMFVVLEQMFTKDPARIGSLLVATFASLVVPALVGLSQLQTAEPGIGPGAVDVGRIEGTFVHPNMFAAYLVVMGLLAVALIPHLPRWRPALVLVVVAVPAPPDPHVRARSLDRPVHRARVHRRGPEPRAAGRALHRDDPDRAARAVGDVAAQRPRHRAAEEAPTGRRELC
jgi:hypothetical protein